MLHTASWKEQAVSLSFRHNDRKTEESKGPSQVILRAQKLNTNIKSQENATQTKIKNKIEIKSI